VNIVFISHVAEDGPLALRIAQGLEAAGYATWYYERDSIPGPSYLGQIVRALERSGAMVVVISPPTMTSWQVDKEVVQAHERNIPFIPLLHTVAHEHVRSRRPEWAMAFGAAVALTLPSDDVTPLLPQIVAGVGWLMRSGASPSSLATADSVADSNALSLTTADSNALSISPTASDTPSTTPRIDVSPSAPAPPPLPTPPTPLVGREREVATLTRMARRPETRLITLTGPGGVGKTRLALQVAAELREDFVDGVAFVALSPLADARLVPTTIAHAIGIAEEGDSRPLESLKAVLGPRNELLVLDNYEQVIEAAPIVADLLAYCPQLTALVTSRGPLRLRGEHEVAVPPLTIPDMAHPPDLESLGRYAAVALFVARAQEVKADFELTAATAPAVAQICARLDGLPLAIELAAARVRLFTPPALLARLSRRLTVLTGGARDLPERQRTLRATIDWSYNLLRAEERTLLARLGVFAGGGNLDAVETVCDPEGTLDALSAVEALLGQGLLTRVDGAGEARVAMLDTIGEYARERLAAGGEESEVRGRHADYYLALAEEAEPKLTGPTQTQWFARIEGEHDNLRAARGWAHGSGMVEVGLRIVIALAQFWLIRGYLSEGREWIETLLASAESSATRAELAPARARALYEVSAMAYYQGDYDRATAAVDASLTLYREIGDAWGIAAALNIRAAVATGQGDYKQAAELYGESLALRRTLGDTRDIAVSLNNLGNVALWQGDYDRATALHEESLGLFRAIGEQVGMATVLNSLGIVAVARDDRGRATALYEESLALARELGDKRGAANALNNLGDLTLAEGDGARARTLLADGLALFRDAGDKPAATLGLVSSANAAHARGQSARAARLLGAVSAAREAMGAQWSATQQGAFDDLTTTVRTALGDEAFEPAWAAGRALSLERAIDEALEA